MGSLLRSSQTTNRGPSLVLARSAEWITKLIHAPKYSLKMELQLLLLLRRTLRILVTIHTGQQKRILYHSNLSLLIFSDVFKQRGYLHAGLTKKPLEPYHPNSYRNRLYQPTFVRSYGNASQIVFGDRTNASKKHFVTTSQNYLNLPGFKSTDN